MEFINSDEFLKQSKITQQILKDLWQPTKGDLYCIEVPVDLFSKEMTYKIDMVSFNYDEACKNLILAMPRFICPLFTEGQLRQIIQNKFSGDVKVELEWSNDGYIVNVVSEINDEKVYEEYYSFESEPIKAYWYAVLQIAKEEV